MNDYEKYIALSRYARYRDDLGRRETWGETCERVVDFWIRRYGEFSEYLIHTVLPALRNREVMGSMRVMMTAGEALDKHNVSGYNCAYLAVDNPRAFDEILYILMCGTGVGFSCERQYVTKLPEISEEFHESDSVIVVPDSKIGWATSFRELISLLYSGKIPKWDTSKVRPKGARLKTFGGRASGPEPLEDLFRFTVETFKKAKGRKLTSIEVHDIVCKIAEVVVVGGVRRSALISLSNLSDDRMRLAKSGQWWEDNPQRALANNSAVYNERPDIEIFLEEWLSLIKSKSGERGIFNRLASLNKVKSTGKRDPDHEWGTNPCSEIILRSKQFCNLSEVCVRPTDTLEDLKRKVEIATVLGTLQSTLTEFKYLRKDWKKNCE